jgi:Holliday junction resolvase RusA-like endonuclease
MKKINNFKPAIFSLFTGVLFLLFNLSVFAQNSTENKKLTTEQEVIDRYLKVTGREKYPDETYFSLQKNIVGEQISETESEKIVSTHIYIEFIDYDSETKASISASKSDKDNSVTRFLDTREKRYMFMEDGTVTENPSLLGPEVFERFPMFNEESTSTEKLSLPNEIFDGEEVYVIHNVIPVDTIEHNIVEGKQRIIISGESYRYFSVKTGFFIGTKTILFNLSESSFLMYGITTSMNISSKSISHIYFKEHRMVGNVILPHKEITIMNDNSEEQTITSSANTNEVITTNQTKFKSKISADIQYNVDIEHFKNTIFKNPEKIISELSNEF